MIHICDINTYLFLSSEDLAPNSTPYHFSVILDDDLDLSKGQYKCALKEIYFKSDTVERIFIFCDIIEYSYLRGAKHPILRSTISPTKYTNPLFFNIKQNTVSAITISLYTFKNKEFIAANVTGVTELLLIIKKNSDVLG